MKFARIGKIGREIPVAVDKNGQYHDLSSVYFDIHAGILDKIGRISENSLKKFPIIKLGKNTRFSHCLNGVGKFIAIGLNYADHAEESGLTVPPEPIIFMKATSSICGANDIIEIPRGSTATDWEIELGVVIGKRAKYIDRAHAMDYVFGYCTVNDVSERDFQIKRHGQWVKGKSHDTFGPIGPYIVSKDEVPDPQQLKLWCAVNGQMRQNGTTATMVYGVEYLVWYLSQFMTLEPGDIITTGTPPGVGMGLKPNPVYLKSGDVITCGVAGLGDQRHICQEIA